MILLNNQKVKFTKFSDGQLHINLPEQAICGKNNIKASITCADDIFKLLLLKDIILNMCYSIVDLNITYLLGARMDRRMNLCQPFTLKIVMELLRKIPYQHLCVLEPHSDVIEALAGNSFAKRGWQYILQSNICGKDFDYLISPDAGMYKKIGGFVDALGNRNVIECSKVRDLDSGNIIATHANCGDLTGKSCLIVDDICDGGRTFIEIAKVLKEKNAASLTLAVCHGIFSQGIDALKPYFNQVITTNSYRQDLVSNDFLKVIDVFSTH